MSCPFLPYGTHSSPREMGCGEERRGCHFFGLWFAAEYPWSVLALSYFRGRKKKNNFLFLFFFLKKTKTFP